MKRAYLLISLSVCIGLMTAPITHTNAKPLAAANSTSSGDIDFYENRDQVYSVASMFNIPIVLYVFDSYTQSCADMERMVFADSEVANFYNNNLVCYKLSINSTEGMKYYNYAKSRPAFIYFNSQFEVIKVVTGFKDKEAFLQLGKDAVGSNTVRETPMDSKYTKFLSDKNTYGNLVRSRDFLTEYIYELKEFNEPYQQVLQEFTRLHDFSISTPDCAKLILDFSDDIYGMPFDLLLSNKQHFVGLFGKQAVEQKIQHTFRAAAVSAANDHSRNQLEEAIKMIPKAKLADGNLLAYSLRALYYETIEDWDNFAITIDGYIKETTVQDDTFLDRVARLYTFAVDEEAKLKNAERWIEQALSIKGSRHKSLETYAMVQYKLNKKAKALKTLDAAVEAAQKQRIDYGTAFRLAEDMRAGRSLNIKYRY